MPRSNGGPTSCIHVITLHDAILRYQAICTEMAVCSSIQYPSLCVSIHTHLYTYLCIPLPAYEIILIGIFYINGDEEDDVYRCIRKPNYTKKRETSNRYHGKNKKKERKRKNKDGQMKYAMVASFRSNEKELQ